MEPAAGEGTEHRGLFRDRGRELIGASRWHWGATGVADFPHRPPLSQARGSSAFHVAGGLEISTGSAPVVGTPQRPLVLAALLTRVNRSVPLDDLTRLLWPDDLPRTARSAVRKHVSLLRTAFRGVDQARIDAFRFRDLVEEARWRAWKDCVDVEPRLVPELTDLVAHHRSRRHCAR